MGNNGVDNMGSARFSLRRGLLATLRISKGQDIQAACGQLITESRSERRSENQAERHSAAVG